MRLISHAGWVRIVGWVERSDTHQSRDMTQYRRNFTEGGTYFFTVNLADRMSCLLVDQVDLLGSAFRAVRAAHPFMIDAIVILPDHLHTIWTLPENDHDCSLRWRLIKTTFSRKQPHVEDRSASRISKGERGIWQRRYWEHLIRDERDYAAHVDYVHINPVKHGHASRVVDWPHSSFHRFVRHGLLPSDWAGDVNALSTLESLGERG